MIAGKNSISRHHKKLVKLHTKIYRKTNFFPGQREGEEVRLCIRTHWLREMQILGRFLLLAVAAPCGIFYLISLINLPSLVQLILNLFLTLYLLFAWLLTFIEFIKSEMTFLVATNERIVDITRNSLFDRQMSEANLDKIQEASGFTRGILGTLIDIGKLEILTAGSETPFVMRFVKSPQLTARKILDIQKSSQQRRRASDFGRRKDDQLRSRKGEKISQEELKKMRGNETGNNLRQRKPNQSV